MEKYNYKNCQSLFGYSAEVHVRCKGRCSLCGCGGEPLDFDLWRQMTVEHLIGKSQGGYLKQIREQVMNKFPDYTSDEQEMLAREIDSINTVTACQFCNSITSRDVSEISMYDMFENTSSSNEALIKAVSAACKKILSKKKAVVKWKLESVKEAFDCHVTSRIK